MDLSLIKNFILIENIGCLFRNYLFYGNVARLLICYWIIIELCVMVFNMYSFLHYFDFMIFQVLYTYSVHGFSSILICFAIYHSKKFKQLVMNFEIYKNIYGDAVYSQTILKDTKLFTFMSVSILLLQQLLFVYAKVLFYESDNEKLGFIGSTCWSYGTAMSHYRFIFEYFFLHAILYIISEQLNTITRSIDKEIMSKKQIDENVLNIAQNNAEMVDKWKNAFDNIYESSKLCNAIFSAQLTLMLLIISAYCVTILYIIAATIVSGVSTPEFLFMNVYCIVMFLIAVFITTLAGQRVQNSSNQLKCKLSQLCIHWIENEKQYRLTKDLLRYARVRPISIRVFGTNDVNMTMLPSIVAFFTSYTVIALQFNNVV